MSPSAAATTLWENQTVRMGMVVSALLASMIGAFQAGAAYTAFDNRVTGIEEWREEMIIVTREVNASTRSNTQRIERLENP